MSRPAIADAVPILQTCAVCNDDHGQGNADERLTSTGAILAGLAVLFGAFGAHALKASLGTEALGWWNTAVQYQMWHALAVLAIGLSGIRRFRLPALLFVGGAMVFSGTLYAMALGAPRWLGAVTPVGGIVLIAGWVLLAWRGRSGRVAADR